MPDGHQQGFLFGEPLAELFVVAVDQVDGVCNAVDQEQAGDHVVDQVYLFMTEGHQSQQEGHTREYRGLGEIQTCKTPKRDIEKETHNSSTE